MGRIGSLITATLTGVLGSDRGLPLAVAELAEAEKIELPSIPQSQIVAGNVTIEVADRSPTVRYPHICVYCDKIENKLTEKFRKFSGKASVVIEVRVSQDRTEGIEQQLQLYTEAISRVLENTRGEWTPGVYFSGAYEVSFGSVRQGGKNFLQAAKVAIELDVNQD
jgi:hypothetical protein